MTSKMDFIADELHTLLVDNAKCLNVHHVDLSKKHNHCSILIYYAGEDLKESSSLGMHSNCIYSSKEGRFTTLSNSQVIHSPTVIYSLGDQQILY